MELVVDRLDRLFDRIFCLFPTPKPAIDRNNVGVTHLLQVVGCESGTIPASTIQMEGLSLVWILRFNISLDNPLPEMNRSRNMPCSKLVILSDINQSQRFGRIHLRFEIGNRAFFDSRSGIIDDGKEARIMLHRTVSLHSGMG